MKLSIIAAMSVNRVIGRNNGLPWKLPPDLRRFQSLTLGHCLLMGRKTFQSIGRPLPGRTTIVVTHQSDYAPAGVLVAHSLEEALRLASGDEVFVAGGAQIYRQTLPLAERLYLTLVEKEFPGDTWFPEYNESDWRLIWEDRREPSAGIDFAYRFLLYERLSPTSFVPGRPGGAQGPPPAAGA